MRVLHYVDENNLAWMAPWIQLLKELTKLGVENIVVCRSGGTLSEALDKAHILNFNYEPIAQWLPQFTYDLGKIIDRVRPDIIHTRLSAAACLGGYWGRKKGIPVVATFDKYPKAKYYKDCDILVGCSSAVTEHIKKLDLPKARMIETILNPVLADLYTREEKVREEFRRKLLIAPEDILIMGMGRFVEWKAWDDYLMAVSDLAHNKNYNLKFILVGSGEEEEKLRSLVSKLGIDNRVTFYPFASDVRPWLWAADIFVQTSKEPEGFSLMLLEAMASGTAPIATDIGGTLDIIKNGENGLLVMPREYKMLAQAIMKLTDSELRCRISANAVQSAREVNVEKIGLQTLELYKKTLRLGKFVD